MGKWSAPSFQLPVASKWRRHPPARAANCQPPTGNWQSARAFTLTELMIAIALVIILAVGVAQVFQMTSQTVSSGQALQTLTRDARAAESVFSNDIQSMVTHTDQPALIIWSQRHGAFLNEHDRLSDEDGDPMTIDLNEDGVINAYGERLSAAIYGRRNHRVDILAFFTSNFYRRQTPENNSGTLLPPVDATANEAFIWYGHLLPVGQNERLGLPQGYAAEWRLGRQAILLDPNASGASVLSANALLNVSSSAFNDLRRSRYDVANATIRQIAAAILNNPDWWREGLIFRLQANPYPQAPYTADDIAQATPIFLNHCTSFIVEYAGDFLDQLDKGDPRIQGATLEEQAAQWGAPVGTYNSIAGSDGQIDFLYHPARSPDAVKQIRWYGLPRDTNSDVQGGSGKQDGAIFSTDVIPLRDLWVLANDALVSKGMPPVGDHAPFERNPQEIWNEVRWVENKITEGTTPADGYANPDQGMQPNEVYYCAWGPTDRKPMLLRITLIMHDPNSRLPDGQTFQYVLKVPGN